jgi:hypothetical protein
MELVVRIANGVKRQSPAARSLDEARNAQCVPRGAAPLALFYFKPMR